MNAATTGNILQNARVMILGGGGLVGSAIARHLTRLPPHLRPSRLIIAALREQDALQTVDELEKHRNIHAAALLRGYGSNAASLFDHFHSKKEIDIVPAWGDIFVRSALSNVSDRDRKADAMIRSHMLDDLWGDFNAAYERSHLVHMLRQYKPQIIVDCINTATVLSYQNMFDTSTRLMQAIDLQKKMGEIQEKEESDDQIYENLNIMEEAEKTMLSLSTPLLIRHVRILQAAAQEIDLHSYLKIGTTGTGGMGLNIPYTHSEDRPSRVLLAKTSTAFGHTGLLMLWSQTPGSPTVKELKPAAAIGYRSIDVRTVEDKYGNSSIRQCQMINLNTDDINISSDKTPPTTSTSKLLPLCDDPAKYPELGPMRMCVIDMGENGIFTEGEFMTITAPGQMEMITPEEISEQAVEELLSVSTGHNVLAALRGAVLGPGYRAGIQRMVGGAQLFAKEFQKYHHYHGDDDDDRHDSTDSSSSSPSKDNDHGMYDDSNTITAPSVALGKLGPPQLSKLLFEAYILATKYGTWSKLKEADTQACAKELADVATEVVNGSTTKDKQTAVDEIGEKDLRSSSLLEKLFLVGPTIGVPILVEGNQLLRGSNISIPPIKGAATTIPIPTGKELEAIANKGWIDLRRQNMITWKKRATRIVAQEELMKENSAVSSSAGLLSSSPNMYQSNNTIVGMNYNNNNKGADTIDPSAVAAWILSTEFQGNRDIAK